MIPTGFTDQQIILFAQRLVAQHAEGKILSDKWMKAKIKPARNGRIYGKGGEGKVPRFPHRVTITFTDEFKKLISKEQDNLI